MSSAAAPSRSALRPLRDGLTWLSYAQLFLFAWFNYALGATNALLRDEQGVTRTLGGLHGTAYSTAGIIAGLLSSRAVASWSRGIVLRLGSLGVALGLLVYLWPGAPLPVTLGGIAVVGFFGTFIVISVNAFLLSHQGPAGPASLTEANAIASVAGLIAPLAVGAATATVLGWRAGLAVVILGLIGVEIVRGRRSAAFDVGEEAHAEHRAAPMPRRVWWTLVLIACFLGTEFSAVYWSADLLRQRAGFSPAAAAAALAAVTGGMALGRWAGSRLAQVMPSERILRWSVVVTAAGFAVLWVPQAGPVMLAGMFVLGLGMSVHWPLGVARAVHASGGMADRAAARASVAGSVAIATLPFLLGALSDAIGIHAAFLLIPVLLVIAMAILMLRPEDEHSVA